MIRGLLLAAVIISAALPARALGAPDTYIGQQPVHTTETPAIFTFTGDSGTTGFQCSLDGEAPSPCSSPQTYNGLTAQVHTFTVAATDNGVDFDTTPASHTWRTFPAPPPGPMGLSINRGDKYTNDPKVTLTPIWHFATYQLLISNDGGFQPFQAFTPAAEIPWRLDSSGPERLPKTVYWRYSLYFPNGLSVMPGASGTETDDIILDETKPTISSATLAGGNGGAVQASGRNARAAASGKVIVAARDRTSGLKRIQLAVSRKRPEEPTKFKRRVSFRGKAPRFVRVRDGAGNFSRWHPISN